MQGAVPSMEEGRQQNAGYLNASAAAERLQRNVNREHFLCTDFLLAFWQVCAFSHVACPGNSGPTTSALQASSLWLSRPCCACITQK